MLKTVTLKNAMPPVVALALVLVWNGTRERKRTEMAAKHAELEQRIELAERGRTVESGSSGRNASRKISRSGTVSSGVGSIDWSELAKEMKAGLYGTPSPSELRSMMEAMREIEAMTETELIAALDEIELLELSDDERSELQQLLIEPLIETNPELVLTRFGDQIESDPDGVGWLLSGAMGEFAKRDVAAATAWFNREIANGTFESKTLDGRSDARIEFEAALMNELIQTDAAAASARLAAINQEQRREVLEQLSLTDLDGAARDAFTRMIREQLPADERAGAFGIAAEQLASDGGYEAVSSFLDEAGASPEERQAAARRAAETKLTETAYERTITRQDVSELQQWLAVQAPAKSAQVIGRTLAEASQAGDNFSFEQAADLLRSVHSESPSDALIEGFLNGYWARSNEDVAIGLVGLIADPEKQAAMREKFE